MARHTKEMFEQYVLATVGTEYTVLGDYVNARTPLLMKHNICGKEYEVRTSDFKQGKRCPDCALIARGRNRAKTHETFLSEVYKLVGNDYEVLGKYYNWETKIEVHHNKCGHRYEVQPNAFLCGRRCPNCKSSHGELLVGQVLKELGLTFETQKSFEDLVGTGNRKLSYDYYVPSLNLFIEYQGKQHYKPIPLYGGENRLRVQQEHDQRKKIYAEANGCELLEIPYTAKNLMQVRNIINNKLSQSVKQGAS